jgi:hypothetical protein
MRLVRVLIVKVVVTIGQASVTSYSLEAELLPQAACMT